MKYVRSLGPYVNGIQRESKFYWPRLTATAWQYGRTCLEGKRQKMPVGKPIYHHQPLEVPKTASAQIRMDLLGPFPTCAASEVKRIIAGTDYTTRYKTNQTS